MDKQEDRASWWGKYGFETEAIHGWQLGPLCFDIQRLENEWLLHYRYESNPFDGGCEVNQRRQEALESELEPQRFVFKHDRPELQIYPKVADRPIVVRPRTPFHILPHQEVTLYLSTTVWVCFDFDGSGQPQFEVPTFPHSRTWFGPTPGEGELCYASRTRGILILDEQLPLPGRARTAVTLKNLSNQAFHLQRFKLPVARLALHMDETDHSLWTDAVTVSLGADGSSASVNIHNNAGLEGGSELISPPRIADRGFFERAFHSLFF